MDTWHILEQRFHEIGNRGHNVMLDFSSENIDECLYSLSGPVQEGEGRLSLVGGGPKRHDSKPDYSTAHYSVDELWETLLRAGRLLIPDHEQPYHAGAKKFVAMLVKNYGSLICTEGKRTCFANGARVCGMLAGKLANPIASEINVKTKAAKGSMRPNAARDSQWHDWRHTDGLTDAQIRDRWDIENPLNPVPRENAENGLGVVASAIRREEKRTSQGTS